MAQVHLELSCEMFVCITSLDFLQEIVGFIMQPSARNPGFHQSWMLEFKLYFCISNKIPGWHAKEGTCVLDFGQVLVS